MKTIIVNNFIKGQILRMMNPNSYKIISSENNKHMFEVDLSDNHLKRFLYNLVPVKKQLDKQGE